MLTIINATEEKHINFLLENYPLEEIILQTYKCYVLFAYSDNYKGFSKEFSKFSKEIIKFSIENQETRTDEWNDEPEPKNLINGIHMINLLKESDFTLSAEELEDFYRNVDYEKASYFGEISIDEDVPPGLIPFLHYFEAKNIEISTYFKKLALENEDSLKNVLRSSTLEYVFGYIKAWFIDEKSPVKYTFGFKRFVSNYNNYIENLTAFKNLCSAFGRLDIHKRYVILPSKEIYELLLEKSKEFKKDGE